MAAYLIQDVVHRQGMVVDLDGTLDDTFCQPHVDVAVVDDRISHQRVDHTLQIAHRAIGRLGNELDDIGGNLQAVTTALGVQNVDAQLHVGLLQLCNKTAGEAGQQAVLHTIEVYRRTVAGQDNLLAKTEQVVEDVEERVERPRRRGPLLNIVNYQHINGLIEIDEVVGSVTTHGIGKLHLKETCRHIEHTLLGIHLLTTHTDGIDEMCLATARRAEDEEGIERRLARMLGDGETYRARQFVAVALDERLERLMNIQLRVEVLQGGIEHRGSLVATLRSPRSINLGGLLALNVLSQLMGLVGNNSVSQPDAGTEATGQYLAQQSHVVLLQVFVDIRTRNLH